MSKRSRPLPGQQWYRIENASPDVAEVYIYDEIGYWGVTAGEFVRELGEIDTPINLHLNSPGGDVFQGMAIYNALANHPHDVNCFIEALAASIATVIAMGCKNITIAPHARMMIHEAYTFAAGNAEDMRRTADRLDSTSDNIASIYAERADGDTATWRGRMRAETWYTDEEAVAAGLADAIGRSNDATEESDRARFAARQAAGFDLSIFRHGEREAARLREDFGITSEENAALPLNQAALDQLHQSVGALAHLHDALCADDECSARLEGGSGVSGAATPPPASEPPESASSGDAATGDSETKPAADAEAAEDSARVYARQAMERAVLTRAVS